MGCDVQRSRAEVAGVVVQQPDGFRHRGTACSTLSYTWRDSWLGSVEMQSWAGVKGGWAAQRPACSIPVGALQHDHKPPPATNRV
ncbi:unnamed protein product [Gadus morhua 'NCC']